MTLATIDIIRRTGATGTPTDTTVTASQTRLKTDDNGTVDANNPIPSPGAGFSYSYWAVFRLNVTANPDAHTINNVRVYTTGGIGSGGQVVGQDATTYVRATGTTGVTGTILNTTNYSTLTGAPVDVFGWTSGATKSLGAGSTTSTGQVANWLAMQVILDPTFAPATPASASSLIFRYDEA